MENIFKEGDKVFHLQYGWGTVTSAIKEDKVDVYCVDVEFENNSASFTEDGKEFNEDLVATLSFTEYDFNGFSQKRPIDLPEKGEPILVKNNNHDEWFLAYFEKGEEGYFIARHPKLVEERWIDIKRFKFID